MSRSFKKPWGPVAGAARGTQKKWKRQCNGLIRRAEEHDNYSFYKKVNDPWGSPIDGKRYYGEDPKWKRK